VDVEIRRSLRVDAIEELVELDRSVAPMRLATTVPVFASSAANREVVPWRL